MKNLVVSEGEEIKISGRELHMFLEVKTLYKDWFPRMCEYGFTENVDFNVLKNERVQIEGGKEISMLLGNGHLLCPLLSETQVYSNLGKF